jgi:hypothetical protein
MAHFQLDRRFALALAPFRSFMLVPSPNRQRQCLESVREHLVPGGRLIVDLFDPRLDVLGAETDVAPNPDRGAVRHPMTGNEVQIQVLSRSTDRLNQTFDER